MSRYPERLLTDDESIIIELRPHWRVLIPSVFWVLLSAATLIVIATQFPARDTWVLPTAGLMSVLFVAGLALPPFVRWWFTQYVLTTERIVVRTGMISRSGSEIPLESISNVLFSQRVIERLLGYGDVMLESAGESGQSRLRDVPKPEDFQSKVYAARETRALHFSTGGASNAGPRDAAAQLRDLAELHERGRLTDDEYAAQKAKLLEG